MILESVRIQQRKEEPSHVSQRDLASIRGKDLCTCRQVKERTCKNYAATERTYEITFDSNWQESKLKYVSQEMGDMFENGSGAAETGYSKFPDCHGIGLLPFDYGSYTTKWERTSYAPEYITVRRVKLAIQLRPV